MSSGNGLPKGWVETRLHDLVVPGRDHVNPSNFSHLPFVGLEHVEASTMRLLGTGDSSAMKSSSVHFYPGDVLYGRLRPYLNKVIRPDFEGLCSAEFIVFPQTSAANNAFVQYRINAADFVFFASHLDEGDRPRVDFGQIGAFAISLPPWCEQVRIVAKIEELFSDLDAAVAALEHAKAKLKRYRAAVLKAAVEGKLTTEWRAKHPPKETGPQLLERILKERRCNWEREQLAAYEKAGKKPPANWQAKYKEPAGPDVSGLPELPESWCWASVAQVAEVQGGIQKQPKRRPLRNAYPFLRVANVYRNRLDLSEVHEIELFGDELERLRLLPGDLLIVEGNGSITEIGRSALWQGGIENCVHQNHIIRVRLLAGQPGYLNAYWNSPSGNARVMESAASTSGLYTLSVAKVSSLPVPIAPICEQQQIVVEVDRLSSIIGEAEADIEANLKRSVRLRQSILKRAFEGKLVPQDSSDEPASVLLERIKAERADTNGKAKPRKTR